MALLLEVVAVVVVVVVVVVLVDVGLRVAASAPLLLGVDAGWLHAVSTIAAKDIRVIL